MFEGIPSSVFKDYFRAFRIIHNTRGEVGKTCCSPKSELRRQESGSKLFKNIASEMKDSKSAVVFKTRIFELYYI